ncbi:MAG: helix-turn-helix domain-containing protein [Spirochaetes bacterium]|nr:helix-turn-helix domain-containing protein [Spirochaetota bacterium]
MASIGPKLQEARLKKGLTLERIADDTNIALRFLSKIENDDFTGFPGEPYIVGFIRNYAEYLGLDPQPLVAAYRGVDEAPAKDGSEEKTVPQAGVIQTEQPTALPPEGEAAPLKDGKAHRAGKDSENPLESKSVSSRRPTIRTFIRLGAAFAILIVVAAAFWILAGGVLSTPKSGPNSKAPVEYRVEGSPFEKRLYVGDSLLVPLGEEVYKIVIADIGDKVELDTPFGRQSLKLGESGVLDPNSDGAAEATLSIADFEKRRPTSGALVNVSLSTQTVETAASGEVTISGKAPALGTDITGGADKAKSDLAVILRSGRGPYPFVVQVSFRGSCLFRYEADRKEWVEKYYGKGESTTINVNSALTIWTSNAQAAKLSFPASGSKLVDLELGAPGEIAVKRIYWDSSEGSWALVASSLD